MSAMEYTGPERRRRPGEDQTRILIVDDHVLFRVGIAQILSKEADLEVVGEAEDARSAMEAALETSPNIILMDLSLPTPGGIETTQRIKRELPSVSIIVLAVHEDEDALFDAIKAGAAAFILKDVSPEGVWSPKNLRSLPKALNRITYHVFPLDGEGKTLESKQADVTFRLAVIARLLGWRLDYS